MRRLVILVTPILLLAAGCEAVVPPSAAARGQSVLLQRTSPADGAHLSRSPETLNFTFARPARLIEVTVTGADGSAMPMMVTAPMETREYRLPLSGLAPGAYRVAWRAESGGQPHQGEFRFSIRGGS